MADQHQKFGNERNELNAEVTRLNARVDELEYQMLHGGSDAEKAIRAQMMEAYVSAADPANRIKQKGWGSEARGRIPA